MFRFAAALAGLAALAILGGCAGQKAGAPPAALPPLATTGPLSLEAVEWTSLPGWGADRPSEALPAFRASCARIVRLPEGRAMGSDGRAGLAADWLGPCGALRQVADGDNAGARAFFEQWFQPYRAMGGGGLKDGLFTGYYEPELNGSRRPGGLYRVPLHARPAGLPADPAKAGQPYFTRAEIEAGAMGKTAKVLAWVDDPVDAHILQIQGSGRIRLDTGEVIRLGFDGSNGRPFVGLGRILVDAGKLEPGNVTMQAVRAWLKANPGEAPALMARNPRYVFFRQITGDGPVGAGGVALTPGRSLAVDTAFVGLGTPLWLVTTDPDGAPIRRLMIAQDTGAAIKGPIRGDYFWGPGEPALEMAGRMKSRGGYYLLLPRLRSVPVASNGR